MQEIYGYYTSFSFALPPSVMYVKVIDATKTLAHMQLVDGDEVALELHLSVGQELPHHYFLDLKIPKDTMVASLMASAKAEEYSKEVATVAADDIGKLVGYIRQIPKVGKE